MGLVRSLSDPNIRKHLLRDEGEVIVDEVMHHWVMYVLPVVELVAAVALLVALPFVNISLGWFVLALVALLVGHALWRALAVHRDRFVITNMRVFRVHGVLSQQHATMPLSRILDITVVKPFQGRILGFGHFVFESAAQEQGLRDIRYVARPDERDLAIQRVVQRSGLRGPKVN
ncbi:PH domain-containing protein [Nocardioides dubius]|uniref:YdbS-like PH domain-containing protein n=1 Tax=Nocardioides dubius TaxID=317019 RepID=A0ABP4E3G4_9ACTN